MHPQTRTRASSTRYIHRISLIALVLGLGADPAHADPDDWCVKIAHQPYWNQQDVELLKQTCNEDDVITVNEWIAGLVCNLDEPSIGSNYVTCVYRGEPREQRLPSKY